jgi:hypothetical protein
MLVVEGVVEQVLLEPPELDHILLVLVDLVEMVSHILLLVLQHIMPVVEVEVEL